MMDYKLTRKLREHEERLLPFVADLNGVVLVIFGLAWNSGLLGIDDDLDRLIGIERVENREEVFSLASLALRV